MTRRALLFASLAAGLRADSAQEVWDLLASLAAALSEASAAGFMAAFDPSMPGYEELRSNVTALLKEAEVQSTVEPLRNEGGEASRTVEVKWGLTLAPLDNSAGYEKRERGVVCRAARMGRKWRIVSFEPLALFAPPRW